MSTAVLAVVGFSRQRRVRPRRASRFTTMQLRMTLAELGMASIPSLFPVPKVQDAFDEAGRAKDPAWERRVQRFLDELEWHARALKEARMKGTPY